MTARMEIAYTEFSALICSEATTPPWEYLSPAEEERREGNRTEGSVRSVTDTPK